MESVAEGHNSHTCSACQTTSEATHDSDNDLCPGCRNVFRAAEVLLRSGIVSEEELIPTLVFARIAGRAEDPHYEDHYRSGYEPAEESVLSGKHPALVITRIVERVPIVKVKPFAVSAEKHPGTEVLKQVRIRTLSKKVKSSDVAKSYEQLLEQEGARWDKNNHGDCSYNCLYGFLELAVTEGSKLSPLAVDGFGEDLFRHPAFHFPPPEIVEGVHEALKTTFANRLDLYGKAQKKTPDKLIPAFAAWHVGAVADVEVPPASQRRVAKVLNDHLLEPCGLTQLEENKSNSAELVWPNVRVLWPRFINIQQYAIYSSHRP
jgi:hypothetical protein